MHTDEIIEQIMKADTSRIDDLLHAVFERKRTLYPQWDILYPAIPRDDWDERRRILESVLQMESHLRKIFEESC